MRYDDMAGLDMYDGLDGMPTAEDLKDYFMAAGAGAGALLLGTWLMPKLPAPATWTGDKEVNAHRMRAGIAVIGGLVLGHVMRGYNRDLGTAVLGAVGGLGVASIVGSFITPNFVGTPFGQLSADDDYSSMNGLAGDEDASMALAALEAANVGASRPAFGDPSVTRERLQGMGSLDAAMVQAETLGGYPAYLA